MADGAYDVAVVGGGPVGMWLAAELHRGGVRPVVLERRAQRPPYSKALTIYPRTVEQFAMRGLVDRWLAEGTPVPSSHFALLKNRLDFSFLPTRYPYTLFLPQRRTEELLEQHLAELGVPYLREHAVTGLRQDEDGVELDLDTPSGATTLRAPFAVGCDGASSLVRAAAGIDFAGTPDTWRSILGDVELTDPPPTPALSLNTPGGSMYMIAIGGGRYRVAPIDHATLYDPADAPVTFGELQASTRRLAGTDFGMRETSDTWLSRVGNAARQASRYRSGRVFLAGDAAHIHYPAGGQGLNLGLQDAANLAWKLAAELRGWAPPGLLDSYHAERYPVGLDVIDDSLAQCALIANSTREGIALRDRFDKILGTHPSLSRELALRLSGLTIRYPAPGQLPVPGHVSVPGQDPASGPAPASPGVAPTSPGGPPAGQLSPGGPPAGQLSPAASPSPVGERAPDLALRGAPAATIFALLRTAKFVLLTLAPAAPPVPALSIAAPPPPALSSTAPPTSTLSDTVPPTPTLSGTVPPTPTLSGAAPSAPASTGSVTPGSAPAASVPSGYADRLDVVTAELAESYPAWAGLRSVLIRPDGYVAWATSATDPPPLTTWLGTP